MSVSVSIRSGSISDTLKTYAENKGKELVESYPKITSVTIVLDIEKKARYKAEIIVHGKNINIEADSQTFDMHEAVDTAFEKVVIQLDKHFDKVQDHKSKAGNMAKITKETEE